MVKHKNAASPSKQQQAAEATKKQKQDTFSGGVRVEEAPTRSTQQQFKEEDA